MQKHLLLIALLVSCNLSAMEGQPDCKKVKTTASQESTPDQTTLAPEPTHKKAKVLSGLTARERLAQGQQHTTNGNWQEAVDAYQEVLALKASTLEQFVAFKNLGKHYTLNGSGAFIQGLKPSECFLQAIEYFNQALMCLNQTLKTVWLPQKNVNAQLSELYPFIAIAYKESHNMAAAITCAERALKCMPDRPTRISLYTILAQSHRPTDLGLSEKYLKMAVDEALQLPKAAYPEECNRINNIYASLYKELGNAYVLKYKKGDLNGRHALEQAQIYYTRSIVLNPGLRHRSSIWVQLALIHKQQSRPDDARHALSLVIQPEVKEINPAAHAAALALLGKIK